MILRIVRNKAMWGLISFIKLRPSRLGRVNKCRQSENPYWRNRLVESVIQDEIVAPILAERRAEKDAWIVQARADFVPSARTVCAVCGKFHAITHAHHVVPLAMQYDRGVKIPDHTHVWLCPNHHVILHMFTANNTLTRSTNSVWPLYEGLNKEQLRILLDLWKQAFEA